MNKLLALLILLLAQSQLALSDPFPVVPYPLSLSFPRDHGSHPEHKTEWWYFTGHLHSEETKQSFGFELTFFRVALKNSSSNRSAWKSDNIFLAHFAVTDDKAQRFYFTERTSRESLGMAGAEQGRLHTWLGAWKVEMKDDLLFLSATDSTQSISLELKPMKPVTLQGDRGYSKKGIRPSEASGYSSFTNLKGTGVIVLNGKRYICDSVQAWMDHEFFSSEDVKGTHRWDWFALQFDSGEELMVYLLKDASGNPTKFSSGTFVSKSGESSPLSASDFKVSPLSRWKSSQTGKTYPSSWQIEVPSKDILVTVKPTVLEQEILSSNSTRITYWEGRNLVTGSHNGQGYVELVGY